MPLIGAMLVALATVYATWVASRRTAAEFRHDHAVRRREHLRAAIDDCSQAYEQAYTALTDYMAALADDDSAAIARARSVARGAIEGVNIQRGRLELRLPPGTPLLDLYRAVELSAHQDVGALFALGQERPVLKSALDSFYSDRLVKTVAAFVAFRAGAHDLAWKDDPEDG